jgi:hypothetical protein
MSLIRDEVTSYQRTIASLQAEVRSERRGREESAERVRRQRAEEARLKEAERWKQED